MELKHPEMPHFPDSGPREGPDLNCREGLFREGPVFQEKMDRGILEEVHTDLLSPFVQTSVQQNNKSHPRCESKNLQSANMEL